MNRKLSFLAAAASVAMTISAQAATIITQWNFNSVPPDVPANLSTGTTAPSIGVGTLTASNLTSALAFGSGIANGGSTDPAATDNSGLQTTGYPAATVGNKTAGIQFQVSTVGYQDITVSWDQRHSNTSSRFVRLQYTLDITDATPTWVDAAGFSGPSGDTWFNNRNDDLSSVLGLNNNPNAAFRIVAEFDAVTGGYVASNGTSTYAGTGTWRFDMVTVSGNAIPEPAALSLMALGAIPMIRRRRA